MKRAIIRKIALSLAFFQLFSGGLFHNNKKDIKPQLGNCEYVLVDNQNVPIYQKVNSVTGNLETISIFDDENILTRQYGANQKVFRTKADELIQDPLIREELESFFPSSNFECEDDALFFYEKYLYIIYDSGCGYAAAADFVFHLFEGREEEFYEKFGYPMYTFKDGKIDFNYEIFMLKFFNYYNLVCREDYESIDKWTLKDLYEHQAFRIAADNEFRKPYKNRDLTDEEYDELKRLETEHEQKLKEVGLKARTTKKIPVNMGIPVDARYGYLYVYLALRGVNIDCYYEDYVKKLEQDNIVACDRSILYKVKSNGEVEEGKDYNGWHYVYVTETGDQIVVSSWGEKYILNNSVATDTDRIIFSAH